jgi:hypothetical protein
MWNKCIFATGHLGLIRPGLQNDNNDEKQTFSLHLRCPIFAPAPDAAYYFRLRPHRKLAVRLVRHPLTSGCIFQSFHIGASTAPRPRPSPREHGRILELDLCRHHQRCLWASLPGS